MEEDEDAMLTAGGGRPGLLRLAGGTRARLRDLGLEGAFERAMSPRETRSL